MANRAICNTTTSKVSGLRKSNKHMATAASVRQALDPQLSSKNGSNWVRWPPQWVEAWNFLPRLALLNADDSDGNDSRWIFRLIWTQQQWTRSSMKMGRSVRRLFSSELKISRSIFQRTFSSPRFAVDTKLLEFNSVMGGGGKQSTVKKYTNKVNSTYNLSILKTNVETGRL